MKTGDSRAKGGVVYPFQAHNPKWDEDKRPALIGKRVIARLDSDNGLGHYVDEEGSYGDLMGGFIAYTNGGRTCPSWNFALPVVLKGNKSRSRETVAAPAGADFGVGNLFRGSDPGGGGGGGRDAQALPIGGSPDQPDGRMAPIGVGFRVLRAQVDAVPVPGNPGQNGQSAGILFLGIGAQVVPVRGGSFPSFGGVRTNFSSGSPNAGASFSGVRRNFSNGSPRAGAVVGGIRGANQ